MPQPPQMSPLATLYDRLNLIEMELQMVLGLVNQNQAGLHRAAAVLRSVLVHVRAMKALVDAMRLGRAEASLRFPLE